MFWTMVLEKTLERLLDCKEIQPVNPKGNQSWIFIGRTYAEAETPVLWPPDWCEELTHLKRPWWWERLKLGGEGVNIGWDGWMASLTLWTWVWVISDSWCWRGKSGMLQSMGWQRVGHDWATELNWKQKSCWITPVWFLTVDAESSGLCCCLIEHMITHLSLIFCRNRLLSCWIISHKGPNAMEFLVVGEGCWVPWPRCPVV